MPSARRVTLMERTTVEDVAPGDWRGTACRGFGAELATSRVAVNHYRVPPESGLSSGLHAHTDQEEVFVVLAGEATFETLDGPVTVTAREAVRFAPREF